MSETAKNEAFELWWNGQTRFVANRDLAYIVWSAAWTEAYKAGCNAGYDLGFIDGGYNEVMSRGAE